MAHEFTTKTTANDVVFNAAISGMILNEARASLVAADKVLRWEIPTPGPASITVPRFQAVTVDSLSEGTAQEANAVSTDGVTISSARYGALIDLTDESAETSVPQFSQRLLERAGVALAQSLDTAILALATGFSGNVINSTGAVLTFANFQEAIFKLEDANAPKHFAQEAMLGLAGLNLDSLIAFLAPVQVLHLSQSLTTSGAAWLSDPKNSSIAYVDGGTMPGFKGSLLGVPVFQSSNVAVAAADRVGMMISPAAIGLAVRYLAKTEMDRDIKTRTTLMALTSEFGVAELVDVYGCKIVSKTAA